MYRTKIITFSALFILIVLLSCGGSNAGQKVGTQPANQPATVQVEIYKAGDVVQVEDHTIVLNSAGVQGGVLKANFTVENKGAGDLTVSSLLGFSAKSGDGTKLEQQVFGCNPALDGKVLPGDKLKGNICWSGASAGPYRIYYEANIFKSGAVVWEVRGPSD